MRRHLRKIAYPVVIDPDGSMADELGVIGLPTSFLIDADGKVLREWPGYTKRGHKLSFSGGQARPYA